MEKRESELCSVELLSQLALRLQQTGQCGPGIRYHAAIRDIGKYVVSALQQISDATDCAVDIARDLSGDTESGSAKLNEDDVSADIEADLLRQISVPVCQIPHCIRLHGLKNKSEVAVTQSPHQALTLVEVIEQHRVVLRASVRETANVVEDMLYRAGRSTAASTRRSKLRLSCLQPPD